MIPSSIGNPKSRRGRALLSTRPRSGIDITLDEKRCLQGHLPAKARGLVSWLSPRRQRNSLRPIRAPRWLLRGDRSLPSSSGHTQEIGSDPAMSGAILLRSRTFDMARDSSGIGPGFRHRSRGIAPVKAATHCSSEPETPHPLAHLISIPHGADYGSRPEPQKRRKHRR